MKLQIKIISAVWVISGATMLACLGYHFRLFGFGCIFDHLLVILLWLATFVLSICALYGKRWAFLGLGVPAFFILWHWISELTTAITWTNGGPPFWYEPLMIGSFLFCPYTIILILYKLVKGPNKAL